MRREGAERLERMLTLNHELAAEIDRRGFPLARFEIVPKAIEVLVP